MQRQTFLKILNALILGAVPAYSKSVLAQNTSQIFAQKPIKIVVPNAAGGAADITARTVGQKLASALSTSVVIDNKASAGGIVAGELVARSEADGHTLLLISSGTAVSNALFKTLPFDTARDFAPISMLATFDLVFAVAENSPYKSFDQLLAFAKANPGKLNIGTPQIGTTQNLAAELFKQTAGVDIQVVPFQGTPPVINALRGGQIDVMVDILGPLMSQFSSKALRPLALLGTKRSAQFPDVPAVREAGGTLKDFNVTSWNGLAAPARTAPEKIAILNREIGLALKDPDVQKRLLDLSLVPGGSSAAQVAEFLVQDTKRWEQVMTRAKIERQ